MAGLEIAFIIGGLTFFILPVFYLYNADTEGVKDPAAEEVRKRQERSEE